MVILSTPSDIQTLVPSRWVNLCWTDQDRAEWNDHFLAIGASGDFAGTFSQVNLDEFFAEMTQSYFEVNNEIGGREAIGASSSSLLASLVDFYGEIGE